MPPQRCGASGIGRPSSEPGDPGAETRKRDVVMRLRRATAGTAMGLEETRTGATGREWMERAESEGGSSVCMTSNQGGNLNWGVGKLLASSTELLRASGRDLGQGFASCLQHAYVPKPR